MKVYIQISWTLKITKRYWEDFSSRRHACYSASWHQKEEMGYFGTALSSKLYFRSKNRRRTKNYVNITEWLGLAYVEATRDTQHRNYWRQLITSDPAMEGTTQELLAATHYIRPSNGRNNTGTTGGNSLHPTQQWTEQHRNYWRQLITSDPAMDGTWRRRMMRDVTPTNDEIWLPLMMRYDSC